MKLSRSEQLKGEGIILGTSFLNEDYQSDEPGAKIVKELKIREIDEDNWEDFRYSTRFNNDRFVPFVLEGRIVRESDLGRYHVGEWQPLNFAHSEDDLLNTSNARTIDSIVDPKLQEKRDEGAREKVAAEAELKAKKVQEESIRAEHREWLNTHGQAQYQATKGKKSKITIPLVSLSGEVIPDKKVEVDATVHGDLAVHKAHQWWADGKGGRVYAPSRSGYVITHVASGRKLYESPSLSHIRRMAAVFNHEIDWQDDIANMPPDELARGEELLAALKEERKPSFIDLSQPPTIRETKLKPKDKALEAIICRM